MVRISAVTSNYTIDMGYKNRDSQLHYQREHYRTNKAVYAARTREAQKRKRQILVDLKNTTPCTDCGKQYPHYVMEFDHVRGQKRMNVSAIVTHLSMQAVHDEIAKCDIVCSNCHAERTWQQRQKEKENFVKPNRGKEV